MKKQPSVHPQRENGYYRMIEELPLDAMFR